MNWTNAGIVFISLLHSPFFIWFVIALLIATVFTGKDPKFKKER